jgi:hypothetical protein
MQHRYVDRVVAAASSSQAGDAAYRRCFSRDGGRHTCLSEGWCRDGDGNAYWQSWSRNAVGQPSGRSASADAATSRQDPYVS